MNIHLIGVILGIVASLITIYFVIKGIVVFFINHAKLSKENISIKQQNKVLIDTLNNRAKNQELLFNTKLSIDNLLLELMNNISVNSASIYIKYGKNNDWHILLTQITNGEIVYSLKKIPFKLDMTTAGKVFNTKQTEIINDVQKNKGYNKYPDRKTGFKTKRILNYPVFNDNKEVIAVIQLLNKSTEFLQEDIDIIQSSYHEKFSNYISKFINIPNYIDSLEIHENITEINRVIVSIDMSRSQKLFNEQGSEIIVLLILREYYELVMKETSHLNVFVENYIGDGILLSFEYNNDIDVILDIIKALKIIVKEFDKLKQNWINTFSEEIINDIHLRIAATIGDAKLINLDIAHNTWSAIMGGKVNQVFNICNELTRDRDIFAVDDKIHQKIYKNVKSESLDIDNMYKTKKTVNGIFEILEII